MCVESSADALAGALDNLALNGVAGRAEVRAVNAFDERRRLDREGARFGLVVLDPPPSRGAAARSRPPCAATRRSTCARCACWSRGGLLATFCRSHHVSESDFEAVCRDAATDAGVRLRTLAPFTQSADHPVLLTVPETRYLKGLLLQANEQRLR